MLSLHHQLKTATAELHKVLDSQSVLSEYTNPQLTSERLDVLLRLQFSAYREWQLQLDHLAQKFRIPANLSCELHTDVLESDLDNYQAPQTIPSLGIRLPEHYLGCAYVFKGSHIGNRYILRQLKQNHQIHPAQLAYFEVLAADSLSRAEWSGWLLQLEQYCQNEILEPDAVCDGAIRCFKVILEFFTPFAPAKILD